MENSSPRLRSLPRTKPGPFGGRQGTHGQAAMNGINPNGGFLSYGNMESYAMWVATGVASAFFASLERCSCIHLHTAEDDGDEEEEDLEEARRSFSRPIPEYYYDRSGSSASVAKM